ncbi:hypothetical protein C1646_767064 [Rhizophagus diaphanus]|nr:hypothetical protein C1646_767064 [Rhizophagus diaphanus] [Rhizophagus sp. MUCL 43196]
MSLGKNKLINNALNRSYALIDYNIHNDVHKQYEFRKQILLYDESLTENEKSEAIRSMAENYDLNKLTFNKGTKRICENCNKECLATTYCEYCVRNYLKANFSNWTSENVIIDNLIQESNWINGKFIEWDSEGQQLKRFGRHNVVLKRLENVENANQSWIEEAKSHLNISNKWSDIVQCYGLTQDPSNGNLLLFVNCLNKEQEEAFHSNKSYDFNIPNNIDDFNKFSGKKNSISKISSIFKAAKGYPIYLKEAQKMANIQNDYKFEAMQRQTINHHIKDNDENEMYNNPNLHSEEQDELELPDSKNLFLNVKFY